MLAIELLSKHFPTIYESKKKSVCNICGNEDYAILRIQEGNFLDWQSLKIPDSAHTCIKCASVIKADKNKIRKSCWIVNDKQLIWLKKQDCLNYLLNPIDPPFAFYITTSYQKNGYLWAPVNISNDNFIIAFETLLVDCNRAILTELHDIINEMYIWFSFDEIRTGSYSTNRAWEMGSARFIENETILKHYRGVGIMDLIIYCINSIAPSEKKEKQKKYKEVYNASIGRTVQGHSNINAPCVERDQFQRHGQEQTDGYLFRV